MSKRKTRSRVVFALVILILVLIMIYSGLQILEATVFRDAQSGGDSRASKTITRDGVDYFPRQDITVIMVLGIDEEGLVQSSGFNRNYEEADMVMLLILDKKDETYSILALDRDTMVEMPTLDENGKQSGTYYGQLALSHTYGEGLEDSCENSRTTVSNLLYGITIDHYVSMKLDAIAIANDAVGGVTVTVTDDFSAVDESLVMGEITLHGTQAQTFVRSRKNVSDQLNTSRMKRQEEYMSGFMAALHDKLSQNSTFGYDLYDQVSKYVVTDCSVAVLGGLMQRCAEYTLKEIVTPEGEKLLGEKYYELYLDEEALDDLILRLFYAEK